MAKQLRFAKHKYLPLPPPSPPPYTHTLPQVIIEVGNSPVPGGHFGSVSDCRRTLDAASYPTTLTFRDVSKYLWLSRMLAAGAPK